MKYISSLFVLLILMSACSKNKNDCPTPRIEPVSIYGANATLEASDPDYGFIEVEYGPNGFSKGSGIKKTVSTYFELTNLQNGTYDIYARGNCGGDEWSGWSGAKSFIIDNGSSSTCGQIGSLDHFVSGTYVELSWYFFDIGKSANYYQVEYGPTGFQQGQGEFAISNTRRYDEGNFTSNTTYDFYVRANCGGEDWGPWSDVHSFYVEN